MYIHTYTVNGSSYIVCRTQYDRLAQQQRSFLIFIGVCQIGSCFCVFSLFILLHHIFMECVF